MNVPVVMPQLGLTMTEGSVSEWLKKPGDTVRKGEMLFVVSTDKADMEVESLDEGTLAQIVVQPGNTVPVGTVIAYLTGSGEAVTARPAPSKAPDASLSLPVAYGAALSPAQAPATAVGQQRKEGPPASPRARKVARELGIDISQVTPSGGSGRIVEEDVRRFAPTTPSASAKAMHPDLRRRQVIADRSTKSISTIPHFSVSVDVRADLWVSLRASLKDPIEKQTGLKITITDLLLKALALALADTPEMQMVWKDGNPQNATAIDLGLAVASDRGVVAPVIRNVAAMDLAAIARCRQDLKDRAHGGRLSLNDLEGGVGTVSNLGIFRVDRFQAIIIPGQSFILATGRIDRRPWVEAGTLIVAQTMGLTLSVDHRVADGALAGQFLERIAAIIENPYRLLWSPPESK
jgi:pyruvate dehydrogenase E2 component (dihydrolipoamide acetyltransferase)